MVHPCSNRAVTTLAHISDLHFDRVDAQIVQRLSADLKSLKPDLVVVSGDLTQRARHGQYRNARKFLDGLNLPWLAVPGNHDIPLWKAWARFLHPFRRFHEHITAEHVPTWQGSDAWVCGLNSARPLTLTRGFWKDGKLSSRSLISLGHKAAEARGVRVLTIHHPIIPPPDQSPHRTLLDPERTLKVLDRVGIDVVLSGHLHSSYFGDARTHFVTVGRSILCVQAGTATSTRTRDAANAYNVLRITGDRLDLRVRGWTDTGFIDLRQETLERRDEGWSEVVGSW